MEKYYKNKNALKTNNFMSLVAYGGSAYPRVFISPTLGTYPRDLPQDTVCGRQGSLTTVSTTPPYNSNSQNVIKLKENYKRKSPTTKLAESYQIFRCFNNLLVYCLAPVIPKT